MEEIDFIDNIQNNACKFFKSLSIPLDPNIIDDILKEVTIHFYKDTKVTISHSTFIRLIMTFENDHYFIRLFKNGMKLFVGSTNMHFEKDGICMFYNSGICVEEGTYANGEKDGLFHFYDSEGKKISTETFRRNELVSRIIIHGTKKYLDAAINGNGLYGECDDQFHFNGYVLELENEREKRILFYQNNEELLIASFRHTPKDSIITVYKNQQIEYMGEYKLNRESIEFEYDGFGMLFEYPQGRRVCVYKGSFQHNLFHGVGCLYDVETGLKSYEGEWNEGNQVGGLHFVEGKECQVVVKTMEEVNHFPLNQKKIIFAEKAFASVAEFPWFTTTLKMIQEVEFQTDSFSQLETLVVVHHPTLRSLTLYDHTLNHLSLLSILHCPELTTLYIGMDCLNAVKECALECLPLFTKLTIQMDSLKACTQFSLYHVRITECDIHKNSFASLQTIVTNLSESHLSTLLTQLPTQPTLYPTSHTLSTLDIGSPEAVRDLTLQKNALGDLNSISFMIFTELETLELATGCCRQLAAFHISKLPRLQSIHIRSQCANNSLANGLGEFCLKELNALQELVVEDDCFVNYSSFVIESCPVLHTVTIGTKFTYRSLYIQEDQCRSFQSVRTFAVQDCPVLQTLAIGNHCFVSSCDVRLVNCEKLAKLMLGSMTFCNCQNLLLDSLLTTEISISPLAFYHCNQVVVRNSPSLRLQSSSFDHFKNIKSIAIDSCPALQRFTLTCNM